MSYSVGEAAQLAGRSRATIKRLIAAGTLSASRSGPGKPWVIDAAELARVFPAPAHEPPSKPLDEPQRAGDERAVIVAKDALIAEQREALADLRRRLDRADDERERLQQQLGEALQQVRQLTDQRTTPPAPPRRSWLAWRRRA